MHIQSAKRLAVGGVALAAFLALCHPCAVADEPGTAGPPVEPSDNAPVAVPAPTEKAVRYHHGNTVLWFVGQFFSLALPLALLLTGSSAWLRTLATRMSGGRFYPTLAITFVLLSLIIFVIDLPLSFYAGFWREHVYGLSNQRFAKWAGDQAKGLAVGLVIGLLVLWVPYWFSPMTIAPPPPPSWRWPSRT